MRSFSGAILSTQVNTNRNIFQKSIPHILLNLSHEITGFGNENFGFQDHEAIFLQRTCAKLTM